MNVKRSVALVIRDSAREDMLLLVQRPPDDEDLPNVWGLPAASLRPGETAADAARRAGRDKLGLDLEIGAVLNEGTVDRSAYRLEMQLLEARILSGTPTTSLAAGMHSAKSGPPDGTTRYQAWQWGPSAELRSAAAEGFTLQHSGAGGSGRGLTARRVQSVPLSLHYRT
ncbi:MAG TPA: NUDIX hydrolase [Longimicrobiales bacterium]|nr:NUDIX hydrolase [Longimicrobiales bacterium]